MEFGCVGSTYCCILPTLLLTVLSPGANGTLSVIMLLTGRILSLLVFRDDTPSEEENPACVSILAAVGLTCLKFP